MWLPAFFAPGLPFSGYYNLPDLRPRAKSDGPIHIQDIVLLPATFCGLPELDNTSIFAVLRQGGTNVHDVLGCPLEVSVELLWFIGLQKLLRPRKWTCVIILSIPTGSRGRGW